MIKLISIYCFKKSVVELQNDFPGENAFFYLYFILCDLINVVLN